MAVSVLSTHMSFILVMIRRTGTCRYLVPGSPFVDKLTTHTHTKVSLVLFHKDELKGS